MKTLAIACQGGGALTAYQGGMLGAILQHARVKTGKIIISLPDLAYDPDTKGSTKAPIDYELVGLSGTSGGSQNAAIAWNACAEGKPADAAARLEAWWSVAAANPFDFSMSGLATHLWVRGVVALQNMFNLDVKQRSNLYARHNQKEFARQFEEQLPDVLKKQRNDAVTGLPLYLGAMEAISGAFACFMVGYVAKEKDEFEKDNPGKLTREGIEALAYLTAEHLVASACLPDFFGTQSLELTAHAQAQYETNRKFRGLEPALTNGLISDAEAKKAWAGSAPKDGQYLDGLYSENPPISPFMRYRPELIPDEILILRINPRAIPNALNTGDDYADRHNELIGNLSLAQEIHSIRQVNRYVEDFANALAKADSVKAKRLEKAREEISVLQKKTVAVRELDLPWQEHGQLRVSAKFNRTPAEIARRFQVGAQWATLFCQGSHPPLIDWAKP